MNFRLGSSGEMMYCFILGAHAQLLPRKQAARNLHPDEDLLSKIIVSGICFTRLIPIVLQKIIDQPLNRNGVIALIKLIF
jgi:hypothetical protein